MTYIDTALTSFWIEQCGGRDAYLASPIFLQAKQLLDRERKENTNDKRKREFEEAGDTPEGIQPSKKRKHKIFLSNTICSTCCN